MSATLDALVNLSAAKRNRIISLSKSLARISGVSTVEVVALVVCQARDLDAMRQQHRREAIEQDRRLTFAADTRRAPVAYTRNAHLTD